MPAPFKVAVVTPEALVVDTEATEAQIPAHDGLVGILHLRAPLLVKLGAGFLTLKTAGTTKRYFLSGGFAQVKNDVLTVLAEEALPEEKATPELIAKYKTRYEIQHAKQDALEIDLKRENLRHNQDRDEDEIEAAAGQM